MNENPFLDSVSFLRATVSHWDFVTGLAGKMEGKSGSSEDSSVTVNVILNATVIEDAKVVACERTKYGVPHSYEHSPDTSVLYGGMGQCTDLLPFISGTYDSKQLKEHDYSDGPTELTIETWKPEKDNSHSWTLKKKTTYKGVKWLDAAHTGDGGDRMCAGIATFTWDTRAETDCEGTTIEIPSSVKYPRIELRRILQRDLPEPRHPSSYVG